MGILPRMGLLIGDLYWGLPTMGLPFWGLPLFLMWPTWSPTKNGISTDPGIMVDGKSAHVMAKVFRSVKYVFISPKNISWFFRRGRKKSIPSPAISSKCWASFAQSALAWCPGTCGSMGCVGIVSSFFFPHAFFGHLFKRVFLTHDFVHWFQYFFHFCSAFLFHCCLVQKNNQYHIKQGTHYIISLIKYNYIKPNQNTAPNSFSRR